MGGAGGGSGGAVRGAAASLAGRQPWLGGAGRRRDFIHPASLAGLLLLRLS